MKYLYTTCGTQFQVSDEDEIFLAGFPWRLSMYGYITGTSGKYKDKFLHRIIAERMDLDFPNLIDHIDRNKLNNQRTNLRPATRSQNGMNSEIQSNNTSGCTGVHWYRNKWKVSIEPKGQSIYLGSFDNYEEACKVRKAAELKYFEDFAP